MHLHVLLSSGHTLALISRVREGLDGSESLSVGSALDLALVAVCAVGLLVASFCETVAVAHSTVGP